MREQIKRYFKPFPKWALWMIGIGLLSLAYHLAGLLLIVAGVWGLADWSKKPSDAEMDIWIDEDLKVLHPKALSKAGTDVSDVVSDAVMVTGPRPWNTANVYRGFRKGKDNVLRFTPINVTVINFTENQLLVYECLLDLTTGNALNERTDEYFYRDVVSVSTSTKSLSVPGPGGVPLQIDAAEMFQLTTAGGTSVEVLLRAPRLIEQMGGGDIPTTRTEKAIQSVRKMLREKKGAQIMSKSA